MLLLAGLAQAAEPLLAFPGAEGFGRFATGGRGGQIYHVTNLNDSGAGSFRDAVSGSGRIIVFDVCGVIKLQSALVVKGNNTILGQTAPGEGVQVYGNRISFSGASNLIVRHMRFRMGRGGDSGKDACGVANGRTMIFDHLSVLWGRDENFSVSWDNKGTKPQDITIQNSIIGQGLQTHSCGGLIQTDGGVTLYRNLYIENKTRNNKVKGLNQFVNNVLYNWGNGGAYIMGDSEGASWADIEGNYFMNGPWNGATKPFTRGTVDFHYYGNDNVWDSNKNGIVDGRQLTVDEMNGEQSVSVKSTFVESLDALNATTIGGNAIPKPIPAITNLMTAQDAFAWVCENVGPTLPARDEVDQYLIDELMSYGKLGTTDGIDNEASLPHKGTGVLSGGVKPLDSDGDAIPDEWEIANGLNPNDPSDAAKIAANGYANIENYVFTLTEAYPYIKKPLNLKVTRQGKNEIGLSWDLNKNTVNDFIIEYSTDGINFAEIDRITGGTAEAVVGGLQPVTSYWFRVRAVSDDDTIYSDYSNIATAETTGDPVAPQPSVNPFPAVGSTQSIANGLTLRWENLSKPYFGAVTYTVLLGTSPDALTPVAENLTVKSYVTSGLEVDKTYYWRVDAKNDIGTTQGTVWSFSTIYREGLDITAGSLDNRDYSYADGQYTLTFNQDIRFNPIHSIVGNSQYEEITLSASGKVLTIKHIGLQPLTSYAIKFPEGCITDVDGLQSFEETIRFSTCDFARAKQSGDTHFGKAAAELPLQFAPFNTVAPFATVGGLTQTSQNDYPHWVQVSGGVTAASAVMTTTKDKVMTYFDPQPWVLYLDLELTGTAEMSVLESRNCDLAPYWRTLRVLRTADFPFKGELELNPDTRMVKIAPTAINGKLTVKDFRISDEDGDLGGGMNASLASVATDKVRCVVSGQQLTLFGLPTGAQVSAFDIAGRLHATAQASHQSATLNLAPGFYIISISGAKSLKIKI